MTPDQIRAAIEYLDACLRELHQTDAGELRSLTAEEQTRFDEGLAMRQDLQRQLERHETIERTAATRPGAAPSGDGARGGQAAHDRTGDPFDLSEVRTFGRPPAELGRELRDRALQAIERSDFVDDSHRDNVERLLRRKDTVDGALAQHILATGSDAYRSAWSKLMTGNAISLDDAERRALQAERAMSLTAANGGLAVPFVLDPTIILTSAGTINPLRQISTVKTIVAKTWNGVSSGGVTASYVAEATEANDDSPTLSQPAVSAHRAQSFVPASIEVEEDLAGLAADLVELFRDAKDTLEANKFTVGTGVDQPKGVVTAVAAVPGSVVPTTTADTFVVGDVYKLLAALPARHRMRAAWLAQLAIQNMIRQFDTSGGSSLWAQLSVEAPAQLLGKPIHEVQDMDGVINAAASNPILLLGDFSKFLIVDRVGMSVEYIPHLFGPNRRPTGQRGWYCYWRSGSDVLDANAFRLLDA